MAHSASPLRCLTLQLKLKTVPNRTPNILGPLYPQFSPLKLTTNILESPSTPFFLSLLTSNTSENPIGSKICSGSDHFSSPLPTPQCCDHFGPDQSFYNGLLTGLSASAVSSFRLFSTQEVVLVYWNVSQTQVLTRAYVALPDLPVTSPASLPQPLLPIAPYQPHWPFCFSLNTPGSPPPSDFCTCYSSCFKFSSPLPPWLQVTWDLTPHFLLLLPQ